LNQNWETLTLNLEQAEQHLTKKPSYFKPETLDGVKNRFYDLTKVQIGQDQDQLRKDITNDHEGKALKEGCHEREWARTGVSSTVKTNTNKNLVRATTKPKSETQTVTNGCVS